MNFFEKRSQMNQPVTIPDSSFPTFSAVGGELLVSIEVWDGGEWPDGVPPGLLLPDGDGGVELGQVDHQLVVDKLVVGQVPRLVNSEGGVTERQQLVVKEFGGHLKEGRENF